MSMTYDATAQQLAVKVIGTIESNLDYTAVNYGDPITVGIAQWYGVRAAQILVRMRDTNGGSWYGVEPSIDSQLAWTPDTDPFWNGRRLTTVEGESLRPVMDRNHDIQNQQLIEDLDGYKAVAVNNGMDPDANTAAMIFFFAMYHQGPTYALQVLGTAGPTAGLDTLYQACLNNSVLGQYGTRYRTAHDLIVNGMAPDAPAPLPPVPPPPAPVVPNGNARFIQQMGDNLDVHFENGERITFYKSTPGMYLPRAGTADPTPVQPPPPITSGTPASTTNPGGAWTLPLAVPAGNTSTVVMNSGFGPRPTPAGTANINNGFHYGCDFVLSDGSAGVVVAPAPLIVTVAWEYGTPNDPSDGTGGTYCKGHTPDGAYTFGFFHMVPGSLAVAVGDTLAEGQRIGTMGSSGNVTGPHLHFECYEGNFVSPWPPPYGNPVDPLPVLRAHGVNI